MSTLLTRSTASKRGDEHRYVVMQAAEASREVFVGAVTED